MSIINRSRTRIVLLSVIGVGLLAVFGFSACAWRPAIDPISLPAAGSFSDGLVQRGRELAGVGNCMTCHSIEGAPAYAGGYPMQTGFGIVYSTNITPDRNSGIGQWSEEAFARAMREGVRRDGKHLFPVFPYTHFRLLTDSDMKALYAYFMTREPATADIPDNTLSFPFKVRALQAGWKLLFFENHDFQSTTAKSELWNHGAYLSEGLGHCGACHTPRNALGAERDDAAYHGAIVNSWYAPALNSNNAAPLVWTENELFVYLRYGVSDLHGVAAGSMSDVVHRGLVDLSGDDIRAIAVYFADLGGAGEISNADVVTAMKVTQADPGGAHVAGAELYESACASCHFNTLGSPSALRPELSLNSALYAPEPDNFLRLVLQGVSRKDGHPALFMHGYASSLSDANIAEIAQYLRARHVVHPDRADNNNWQNIEERVGQIRHEMEVSE
ncbi:MAG: c-type cytochrome [Woeseiaceae bacterium]|nr:c-type cytochrome [Woeseiaceae bacterium]